MPASKQRTQGVYLRLRMDEKEAIREAAESSGSTIASWCRRAILQELKRSQG